MGFLGVVGSGIIALDFRRITYYGTRSILQYSSEHLLVTGKIPSSSCSA